MRRVFLLVLVVLAAAASLAYLVQLDAGYVLVEFHGWTVEMALWTALLLGCAILVGFYYLARVLVPLADALARRLGIAPANPLAGLFTAARLRRRGQSTRGAIAALCGRTREAVRDLARGARKAEAPFLNYLLAARASADAGDPQLAEGFLQLALETPGSAAAVAIARAEIAFATGEVPRCIALLDAAGLDPATHPAALRLLLRALDASGDWARLASLVPVASRQAALPDAALDALEERASLQLLAQPGLRAEDAIRTWESLTPRVRERPVLLAARARALPDETSARLLAAALKRSWDASLMRAYALCAQREPARALAFAEGFLATQGHDAGLLLALGRIALRNRLWGKARDYLERSIAVHASAAACAELARLCERLGDRERARQALQRAVIVAAGELPSLPLPEAPR